MVSSLLSTAKTKLIPQFSSEIDLIPLEIAYEILLLLAPRDLHPFSLVSHKWVFWIDSIFLKVIQKNWPWLFLRKSQEKDPNWRGIFVRRVVVERNFSKAQFTQTILLETLPTMQRYGGFETVGEGQLAFRREVRQDTVKIDVFPRQTFIVDVKDGKIIHAFKETDHWVCNGIINHYICKGILWKVIENVLHGWELETGRLLFELRGWVGEIENVAEYQNDTIMVNTKIGWGTYSLYLVNLAAKKLIFLSPPKKGKTHRFFNHRLLPQIRGDRITVLWQDTYNNPTQLVMATYLTSSPTQELSPISETDLPQLGPIGHTHGYYEFEGIFSANFYFEGNYSWRVFIKSLGTEIHFDGKITGSVCFPGKIILLQKKEDHYTLLELSTETYLVNKELPLGDFPSTDLYMVQNDHENIILLIFNTETVEMKLIKVNASQFQMDQPIPIRSSLSSDVHIIRNDRLINHFTFDHEKIIFSFFNETHILDFSKKGVGVVKSLPIEYHESLKKGKEYKKGEDITLENHEWPSNPYLKKGIILISLVALGAFYYYRHKKK